MTDILESLRRNAARKTPENEAWWIVISGFDCSEPPATASFVWPGDTPLTIPNTMVLMTTATFAELVHDAGCWRRTQSSR